MAKDKQRIGIAGELLASSKLTELGYTIGVTRKNTPGIDMLVSNGKAAKIVQVKTTEEGKADWVCPKQKILNNNEVYIFVCLNKDSPSSFHIVPSKDVLKGIEANVEQRRKRYIEKNGKEPPNSPTAVFHFTDENFAYNDKWHFLRLPLKKRYARK